MLWVCRRSAPSPHPTWRWAASGDRVARAFLPFEVGVLMLLMVLTFLQRNGLALVAAFLTAFSFHSYLSPLLPHSTQKRFHLQKFHHLHQPGSYPTNFTHPLHAVSVLSMDLSLSMPSFSVEQSPLPVNGAGGSRPSPLEKYCSSCKTYGKFPIFISYGKCSGTSFTIHCAV